MVSLKSIAISSVCVMSMISMSTQQDTLWPLAFQKQCKQQESQINTLNTILNIYFSRRRSCSAKYRKIIDKPYNCQDNLNSLVSSILWPASFAKQHDGFLITQAQAACLYEFHSGRA